MSLHVARQILIEIRYKIQGWWLVFNGTSASIESDVREKAGRGFDENGVNVSDLDVAIVFDFHREFVDAEQDRTHVTEILRSYRKNPRVILLQSSTQEAKFASASS